MAILQFAFGNDDAGDTFKPHNYPRNCAAYTGTHDNDTVVGWWNSGVGDTTRTAAQVEAERSLCRRYLGIDGREIHWAMIRALLISVADTVVVPLQDILGIGSEGRMNLPGRGTGNWRWRFRAEALEPEMGTRLGELTRLYGRFPPARKPRA
jgi:4-alpha-glucanotransferase